MTRWYRSGRTLRSCLAPIWLLIIGLTLTGCVNSLQSLVEEENEEGLVNYALASYGTRVIVSDPNPNHPAETLINGVTSSEMWDQGEGWETSYDGPYAYGRYFSYGQNTVMAAQAAMMRERYAAFEGREVRPSDFNPQDYEETDDNWRGLRGNDIYGGVRSAFGWAVLEFPREVQLNKVVLYTVDSETYPAHKFGVSHVRVQYWAESTIGAGWANVDRYNKRVGQKDDSIKDITTGRVVFRFKPIKTRKIRVAVLWTNDAKRYRTFGRQHYSKGTVRLVEIEAYGFEKGTDVAADTSISEADLFLDQVLNEPNASPVSAASPASETPTPPAETAASPQGMAMRQAVEAYARAYAARNLEALMATISRNYEDRGESVVQLQARMASIFERYPHLEFALDRIEVLPGTNIVEARYRLRLDPESSEPMEGALRFTLEEQEGSWKIQRIDSHSVP